MTEDFSRTLRLTACLDNRDKAISWKSKHNHQFAKSTPNRVRFRKAAGNLDKLPLYILKQNQKNFHL